MTTMTAMIRKRRHGIVSLALVLAAASACEEGVGPAGDGGDGLTRSEAEFLAREMDADLGTTLGSEEDEQEAQATVAPSAEGVRLALAPVTREFEFQRTRSCPNGSGSVTVSGSGSVTVDREARSIELDASGAREVEDCSRQRGDVVFTLNGATSWSAHRKRVEGELVELVHDLEGSFAIVTSDGRERSCDFDLHAELVDGAIRITGELCGRQVDATREVPSRG